MERAVETQPDPSGGRHLDRHITVAELHARRERLEAEKQATDARRQELGAQERAAWFEETSPAAHEPVRCGVEAATLCWNLRLPLQRDALAKRRWGASFAAGAGVA